MDNQVLSARPGHGWQPQLPYLWRRGPQGICTDSVQGPDRPQSYTCQTETAAGRMALDRGSGGSTPTGVDLLNALSVPRL